MTTKKRQINVRFQEETIKKLKKLAKSRKEPITMIMERAVSLFDTLDKVALGK